MAMTERGGTTNLLLQHTLKKFFFICLRKNNLFSFFYLKVKESANFKTTPAFL